MNIGFPIQPAVRFQPSPIANNPFKRTNTLATHKAPSDQLSIRFGGSRQFNPLQSALLEAFGRSADLDDGNFSALRTGFAKFLIRQEAKEILAVKQQKPSSSRKETKLREQVQEQDWTELINKVKQPFVDYQKKHGGKLDPEDIKNLVFIAMEYTPKNAENEMFDPEYIGDTALMLGIPPHKASTDAIIEKLENMSVPQLEDFIKKALD